MSPSSSKIAAITTLIPREGHFDALCAAAEQMVAAVEGEVGTEVYLVAQTTRPKNALLLFELFTDKQAQRDHAAAGDAVGKLIGPHIESVDVLMGQSLIAKGLSL